MDLELGEFRFYWKLQTKVILPTNVAIFNLLLQLPMFFIARAIPSLGIKMGCCTWSFKSSFNYRFT